MGWESKIPLIVAKAEAQIPLVIQATGLAIEAAAKQRARWKTGFMRGEIQFEAGPNRFEGRVVAGANYTVYHEYGTAHMSAQPMLTPAAEQERDRFISGVRGAYMGALGGFGG